MRALETWVIVVAAGAGERLGSDRPKAFVKFGERTLVAACLETFEFHEGIDGIVVAVPEGFETDMSLIADDIGAGKIAAAVPGGASRAESVANALACLPDSAHFVLVHDAARPLVDDALIDPRHARARGGRRRRRPGARGHRHGEAAGAGRHRGRDVRPVVAARRADPAGVPGRAAAGGHRAGPPRRWRPPPTARRWSRPPAAGWSASRATRATSRSRRRRISRGRWSWPGDRRLPPAPAAGRQPPRRGRLRAGAPRAVRRRGPRARGRRDRHHRAHLPLRARRPTCPITSTGASSTLRRHRRSTARASPPPATRGCRSCSASSSTGSASAAADGVRAIADGYAWDVVLGSVHWSGPLAFDHPDYSIWETQPVDEGWRIYVDAVCAAAESGIFDVMAHPDLAKVFGAATLRRPRRRARRPARRVLRARPASAPRSRVPGCARRRPRSTLPTPGCAGCTRPACRSPWPPTRTCRPTSASASTAAWRQPAPPATRRWSRFRGRERQVVTLG